MLLLLVMGWGMVGSMGWPTRIGTPAGDSTTTTPDIPTSDSTTPDTISETTTITSRERDNAQSKDIIQDTQLSHIPLPTKIYNVVFRSNWLYLMVLVLFCTSYNVDPILLVIKDDNSLYSYNHASSELDADSEGRNITTYYHKYHEIQHYKWL